MKNETYNYEYCIAVDGFAEVQFTTIEDAAEYLSDISPIDGVLVEIDGSTLAVMPHEGGHPLIVGSCREVK
jgi:hypothetical protein